MSAIEREAAESLFRQSKNMVEVSLMLQDHSHGCLDISLVDKEIKQPLISKLKNLQNSTLRIDASTKE